jgi:hypothetical protein
MRNGREPLLNADGGKIAVVQNEIQATQKLLLQNSCAISFLLLHFSFDLE